MSRIGKNPVKVPVDVSVVISGQTLTAKGKLGELSMTLVNEVEVRQEGDLILVAPRGDSKFARNMWGTARSLISNIVVGVADGFERKLEVNGIGYRAQVQGKNLVLQLGYSHEIKYAIPQGIKIDCPDQNNIHIKGADKQLVGQTAAEIRRFRPPEPYKGKGIRRDDEYVLRKEGKKK